MDFDIRNPLEAVLATVAVVTFIFTAMFYLACQSARTEIAMRSEGRLPRDLELEEDERFWRKYFYRCGSFTLIALVGFFLVRLFIS